MPSNRLLIRSVLPFLLFTLLLSCVSQKQLTVGAAATLLEEVAKASYKQSDLRIIQEGTPAYLMLVDGMVEAVPDNERLLMAAAQAYSSYASALVQDQDKEYSLFLYAKARGYALRALEQIGFQDPVSRPFDDFEAAVAKMSKDNVPYFFWAAADWGNWISLNTGSMEALAELPRVVAIMEKVLELDESFYYGGPHLFMGIWYASRPSMAGGSLEIANKHFLRAIEFSDDQFLMTYIYYAEYYAKKAFDKGLYVSTLQKVLQIPPDSIPELTLLNTVAHRRAKQLLKQADDYFL